MTAGGLVFIAGTKDERIHAFDKQTGKLLWEHPLPAGGYATPSTYQVNGRQYVVIAAGGAGKLRHEGGRCVRGVQSARRRVVARPEVASHVSIQLGAARSSACEAAGDLAEDEGPTRLFHGGASAAGMPPLGENEYWFVRDEVRKWLDDGVFYLVSPLDSANMTEVELTEEQEIMLNWLDKNQVEQRVRERVNWMNDAPDGQR